MLSPEKIEDIKLQAFSCVPSTLSGVCNVYPLTMEEIFTLGWNKYNSYVGTLLLTTQQIMSSIKEKIGKWDEKFGEFNPLEYLLLSADQNDLFFLELQQIFSTFIKEDIILLPKLNSIVVGDPADKRLITPKNFEEFQNIIRIHNNKDVIVPPPENETEWERKRRINAERVAEAKRRQAQKSGNNEFSIQNIIENAKVYGIDYKKESLYAIYHLLPRYQARETWELNMQMFCAGADSKKLKTKYWGESSNN